MLRLPARLDPSQTDLIHAAGRGSPTIHTKSVSFHRTQHIDLMYSKDEYPAKLPVAEPAG